MRVGNLNIYIRVSEGKNRENQWGLIFGGVIHENLPAMPWWKIWNHSFRKHPKKMNKKKCKMICNDDKKVKHC